MAAQSQFTKILGPEFLESICKNAMVVELASADIRVRQQEEHSFTYRSVEVGLQRFDLLVEDVLIVEPKAIKALEDIHFAQTRSDLKSLNLKHGLLLNFARCR